MPPRPKRKAVDATEELAKRARGEAPSLSKWELQWAEEGKVLGKGVKPMMYLSSSTLEGRSKVASFDIDDTIVTPQSGRTFPTGPSDWKLLLPEIPAKLKEAHDDGFRVVFFTNQAGIEKGKAKAGDLRKKFEDIIAELDIPVLVFVSTGESHFRKPSTEMWDFFVSKCNQGVEVDKSLSIYVGDAAGRAKNWLPGRKKDFSCSDRKFATNVGLRFATPEEYFQGAKPVPFSWDGIDPKGVAPAKSTSSTYHSNSQELIVLVGFPASGKSTFSRRYLQPHGYVSVNRDTLSTPAKCISLAKESLSKGKSVVIDNTNPSKSARAEYLNLAKAAKVPARCIVFKTDLDLAQHLNYVRQNMTKGEVRRIPDVGYNVYKKNYEEPTTSDGFTEVIKLDFVPEFDNKDHERIFKQWT